MYTEYKTDTQSGKPCIAYMIDDVDFYQSCSSEYICIKNNCDTTTEQCSSYSLAQGHSQSNPAQGICSKGIRLP